MITKPCFSTSLTTFVISAALLLGPAPVYAHTRYNIVDLGKLVRSAGPQNGAMAINDRGQVVGGNSGHGFLWTDGKAVDLGTLPPVSVEDYTVEVAYGINNKEQIVASSGSFGPIFMSGLQFARGVLIENREARQFTHHNSSFIPYAINDSGEIVGLDGYRGFFYAHGKFIQLGTLSKVPNGNYSAARNINQKGQVVGWTTVSIGSGTNRNKLADHAFLWQRGMNEGRMRDLGTLSGTSGSEAYSINNKGEVVGAADGYAGRTSGDFADNHAQAFLWRSGKMMSLGLLPGGKSCEAFGINDNTAIVGSCDARAFLWHNGKMTDLNDNLLPASGWVLEEAQAVNNPGQIAGIGTFNGEEHLFLLTPAG